MSELPKRPDYISEEVWNYCINTLDPPLMEVIKSDHKIFWEWMDKMIRNPLIYHCAYRDAGSKIQKEGFFYSIRKLFKKYVKY